MKMINKFLPGVICEIKPGVIVVVHWKCGTKSIEKYCKTENIDLLSLSQLQKIKNKRVVLVMRHPIERLLSAYRMLYVRQIRSWESGRTKWGKGPDERYDIILQYAHLHWQTIIRRPILGWKQWLASDHLQELIDLREAHVYGYGSFYKTLLQQIPNAETHPSLTHLQKELKIPVVREHVGSWDWYNYSIVDFAQATGHVPHLDADFELWNAHK